VRFRKYLEGKEMAKTPKPTSAELKEKKECEGRDREKRRWTEVYPNFITGRQTAITSNFADQLAEDLVAHAMKPETLTVTSFYLNKGIGRSTWASWHERFPQLLAAYNFAKEIIGNRREEGAMKRSLAENFVFKSMPMYSPDWAQREQDLAKLSEDGAKNDKVIIQLESFTRSNDDSSNKS
jgi:hypothetical protein